MSFKDIFDDAVRRSRRDSQIRGRLGKGDTDQTLTVPNKVGFVWVRIYKPGGFSSHPEQARCRSVTPAYNADVLLERNLQDDVLEVIGEDPTAGALYSQNQTLNVGKHGQSHGRWGTDPIWVDGLQFLPMVVRPQAIPDLTVYVEQHVYKDSSGTWQGWTGGSLDLTSHVPGSANQQRLVIVGLDTSTGTLDAAAGSISAFIVADYRYSPFALSDVVMLLSSVGADVLPLAAVRLHYGQTEIQPYHMQADLRGYVGTSTSAGTAIFNRILTDGYDVLTDGYNVLSDA